MQFITDLKTAKAAGFCFKKYKVGAGSEMGDGAPRWSADIILAGKKIGSVNYEGDGSPFTIDIPVPEQDRLMAALKAAGYVLDLNVPDTECVLDEPKNSSEYLTLAFDDFAGHYDELKYWKSRCKGKIVVRLKGDTARKHFFYPQVYNEDLAAQVRKAQGDNLVMIVNEAIAGL
ncbi:hypothetical protein [Pseudomonas baetica]|uniref:hypothetical protein n=1 Tax=Pseudomonas baetica TaxID=674054 RepID=UPI0024059551|nr:hypothetical protein [Pseudomonas baetica]MDF9779016.1 hypothetical protein [Pseudomonas baetica]